ncbi:hypothetical protein [Cellulomonas sp. URHB0016]
MKRILTTTAAVVLAGGLALAGATGAEAASRSGSYSCSYNARLVSTTSGFTTHYITSSVSGASRSSQWATGGYHVTQGFTSGSWSLSAASITNGSVVC